MSEREHILSMDCWCKPIMDSYGLDVSDDLTPVNSLDEIPTFASEDEEADFWRTHSFGEPLLEQMRPLAKVQR